MMRNATAVFRLWICILLLVTSLRAEFLGECHQDPVEECPPDSVSMLQMLREESLHRVYRPGTSDKPSPATTVYSWKGTNGDLLRTGASPFWVPAAILRSPPDFVINEMHGNRLVRATPLIDDKNHIYLASVPGRIYKISPAGRLLWVHQEGRTSEPAAWLDPKYNTPGAPSLMDGNLFSANAAGDVFALDMRDGKEVWRTSLAQSCDYIAGDAWSMTASEGVVIAPCARSLLGPLRGNDLLVALDGASGAQIWTFSPDHTLYNILVACSDGSAVFSDQSGTAYKLKLSDGTLFWKTGSKFPGSFSTGGAVLGPNGVVYVTSNDHGIEEIQSNGDRGMLTALDFETGKELWQRTLKYAANTAAAVGVVYGSSNLTVVLGIGANPDTAESVILNPPGEKKESAVVAIDAATGLLRWSFELPVWYGSAKGDLPLFHECLPRSFGNAVISGDGTVFIGNQNGKLYGIGDNIGDGTIDEARGEVISYDAGSAFQGSPGMASKMLIATTCSGMHVWRV